MTVSVLSISIPSIYHYEIISLSLATSKNPNVYLIDIATSAFFVVAVWFNLPFPFLLHLLFFISESQLVSVGNI